MKLLAEKIREGAKLRPQAYGRFFERNGDGELCSCALGAAIEACGGKPNTRLDAVATAQQKLEVCGIDIKAEVHSDQYEGMSVLTAILDMNDRRGMTREAIANVVESWPENDNESSL